MIEFAGKFRISREYIKWKSQAATMSPADFLSKAMPFGKAGPHGPAVEKYRAAIRAGEKIRAPQLYVNRAKAGDHPANFNVTGHEGRHRMVAAQQEGIPKVPVEIVAYQEPRFPDRSKTLRKAMKMPRHFQPEGGGSSRFPKQFSVHEFGRFADALAAVRRAKTDIGSGVSLHRSRAAQRALGGFSPAPASYHIDTTRPTVWRVSGAGKKIATTAPQGIITVPKPASKPLFSYLHEAGHAKLHHGMRTGYDGSSALNASGRADAPSHWRAILGQERAANKAAVKWAGPLKKEYRKDLRPAFNTYRKAAMADMYGIGAKGTTLTHVKSAMKRHPWLRGYGFSRIDRQRVEMSQPIGYEGGVPLTGRIARDRWVKKLRDEDLDRRDANLGRAGAAGAIAGALFPSRKMGLYKRMGIGAVAGTAGVLGVRQATKNSRDAYGERSRGAKRAESVPAVAALTGAGLLAAKRLGILKKLKFEGKGQHLFFEKPFHGYNAKRHAKTGGLNDSFRQKYNRENGSNLKRPVTTEPSKLKPGSKAAKRRASFCARMGGMQGPTSKGGELTPKGAALKRWNCSARLRQGSGVVELAATATRKEKKGLNPYVGATLSGAISGAGLGFIPTILRRGSTFKGALTAGALGGLASGAIVGGGALIGSRILGEPRSDEGSPFTKRAAIGGTIAGAGAGLAGGILLRKTRPGARALVGASKNWRPAQWLRKGPVAGSAAIGAVGGAVFGGATGADEGQQVDSFRHLRKDLRKDVKTAAMKLEGRVSTVNFENVTVRQKRDLLSKFRDAAQLAGGLGVLGAAGYAGLRVHGLYKIAKKQIPGVAEAITKEAPGVAKYAKATLRSIRKASSQVSQTSKDIPEKIAGVRDVIDQGMLGRGGIRAAFQKRRELSAFMFAEKKEKSNTAKAAILTGAGAAGVAAGALIGVRSAKSVRRAMRAVEGVASNASKTQSALQNSTSIYADAGKIYRQAKGGLWNLLNPRQTWRETKAAFRAGLEGKSYYPTAKRPEWAMGRSGNLVELNFPTKPRFIRASQFLKGPVKPTYDKMAEIRRIARPTKDMKAVLAKENSRTPSWNRGVLNKLRNASGYLPFEAKHEFSSYTSVRGVSTPEHASVRGVSTPEQDQLRSALLGTAAGLGVVGGATALAVRSIRRAEAANAPRVERINARRVYGKNLRKLASEKMAGLLSRGEQKMTKAALTAWRKKFGFSHEFEGMVYDSNRRYAGWMNHVRGDKLVDAEGNPVNMTLPTFVRSAYRSAETGYRGLRRGSSITQDLAEVARGEKTKKREWEKPWFRNAVGATALAGGLLVGGSLYRKGGMINAPKWLKKGRRLADSGIETYKNARKSVEDAVGRAIGMEARLAASARMFDLYPEYYSAPGWDLRDARGRSARVFAPNSKKRERRMADWHETKEGQKKMLIGAGLLGAVAAGTGGVLIGRHYGKVNTLVKRRGIYTGYQKANAAKTIQFPKVG